MIQLAPAARLDGQLLPKTNDEAFVPVTVMPTTERGDPPVFVNVSCCDALWVPTCWRPKEMLLAESDIAGLASPVPVKEIDCGDPVALSMIVTAAVKGPV